MVIRFHAVICGVLLVVCACSAEAPVQSPAEQGEVWKARSSGLAELGLEVSLAQDGSRVMVTVMNGSTEPICIGSLAWPSNRVGLDHFKVMEGAAVVLYNGFLDVVLSDETLRLAPAERWTLQTDLRELYPADWRKARVVSFWAPFYECGPV